MQRANADVGFMFIAYNLKRIMNIIGIEKLIKYLGKLINRLITCILVPKSCFAPQKQILKTFKQFFENSSMFQYIFGNINISRKLAL